MIVGTTTASATTSYVSLFPHILNINPKNIKRKKKKIPWVDDWKNTWRVNVGTKLILIKFQDNKIQILPRFNEQEAGHKVEGTKIRGESCKPTVPMGVLLYLKTSELFQFFFVLFWIMKNNIRAKCSTWAKDKNEIFYIYDPFPEILHVRLNN